MWIRNGIVVNDCFHSNGKHLGQHSVQHSKLHDNSVPEVLGVVPFEAHAIVVLGAQRSGGIIIPHGKSTRLETPNLSVIPKLRKDLRRYSLRCITNNGPHKPNHLLWAEHSRTKGAGEKRPCSMSM